MQSSEIVKISPPFLSLRSSLPLSLMAARLLSFSPVAISTCGSSRLNRRPSSLSLLLPSSILGNKLIIKNPNSNSFGTKHNSPTAFTVCQSLPISEKLAASTDKLPKWSGRAIRSFGLGRLEGLKLKYPETGTEAILMGILVEGTSLAAKFLRDNGITVAKVREEIVGLLGKSYMFLTPPEFPPLTEQAQQALDWAVEEKLKSGEPGEVTTTHLLLGIWAQKQSAGHKVLAALGINDEKIAELSNSINEDVSFVPHKQLRLSL